MKRDGTDANSNGQSHRGGGSWRKDGENSNSQDQARKERLGGQGPGQGTGASDAGNGGMRRDGSNASMGGGRGFQGSQGGGGRGDGGSRRQQGQIVYVLTADKKLEPRYVRTGITNGRFTEVVSGDLQEGDIIITGQNDATGSTRQPQVNSNPLQPRPPMGGPRGR